MKPKLFLNIPNPENGEMPMDFFIKKFGREPGIYSATFTATTEMIESQTGEKYMFSDSETDFQCFAAAQKIKSDYKKSGIYLENIPRTCIRYYSAKDEPFNYDYAILIDISAAYPHALKNNGIITEETFNELMALSKSQRLKAIGMLATRKTKVLFKEGREIGFDETEPSEFAEIYFFAAYEIGELLNKCKIHAKENFLFYWFDGIYIKTDWLCLQKIGAELEKSGYPYSVSWLKNFYRKPCGPFFDEISWTELTNSKKGILKPKPKTIYLPKSKPAKKWKKS